MKREQRGQGCEVGGGQHAVLKEVRRGQCGWVEEEGVVAPVEAEPRLWGLQGLSLGLYCKCSGKAWRGL